MKLHVARYLPVAACALCSKHHGGVIVQRDGITREEGRRRRDATRGGGEATVESGDTAVEGKASTQ
jgi:hypothetical protein